MKQEYENLYRIKGSNEVYYVVKTKGEWKWERQLFMKVRKEFRIFI